MRRRRVYQMPTPISTRKKVLSQMLQSRRLGYPHGAFTTGLRRWIQKSWLCSLKWNFTRKGHIRSHQFWQKIPTVFGSRHDDWQFRMETDAHHILRMSFQGLNASLGLVVPDLRQTVIRTRNEIRFVTAAVIIDAVDTWKCRRVKSIFCIVSRWNCCKPLTRGVNYRFEPGWGNLAEP